MALDFKIEEIPPWRLGETKGETSSQMSIYIINRLEKRKKEELNKIEPFFLQLYTPVKYWRRPGNFNQGRNHRLTPKELYLWDKTRTPEGN